MNNEAKLDINHLLTGKIYHYYNFGLLKEGLVLAAQNAGSLLMVVTGLWADRINGKWMVAGGLILCFAANAALPIMAYDSFWYAVAARFAVGAADACLMPSANSLITRWFPQAERAAAIGIITGRISQ